MDLALSNLQILICHKNQPTVNFYKYLKMFYINYLKNTIMTEMKTIHINKFFTRPLLLRKLFTKNKYIGLEYVCTLCEPETL